MAELTPSTREAARRLGVSDTTMHKAERTGRIAREPSGKWDITKTRTRLLDVATANATIDEIASTMHDALLNWPARATAAIQCYPGKFCVALEATASPQACRRSKPWL